MSSNSGGMDIEEGSYSAHVFVSRTNEITDKRWIRGFGVASASALMTACVLLFAAPSTTFLGQKTHVKAQIEKTGIALTGINAGGLWIHDEFQPRRVWFHDSGSIHSPADEAVAAAQKQAKHVSSYVMSKNVCFL